MKRAITLLWAALREIFDERAFDRYLERTGLPPSPDSYSQFVREQSAGVQKQRCC